MEKQQQWLMASSIIALSSLFVACGSNGSSNGGGDQATVAPTSPGIDTPINNTPAPQPTSGHEYIQGVVSQAQALQAMLSSSEQETLLFDYETGVNATTYRHIWSNLPESMVNRNGIRLADLTTPQKEAVFRFLKSALSTEGYNKVVGIVNADGVLGTRSRAGRFGWSAENYYLAFFGTPSESDIWGWQFGGHHLALNVTHQGDKAVMSPTFIGVEPAVYTLDNTRVEPLAGEVNQAIELVSTLDDSTRDSAQVNSPRELWSGARKDGVVPSIEGVALGNVSQSVQDKASDLVSLWVSILPDVVSQPRMDDIKANFSNTYFGWDSGSSLPSSEDMYYRIQNSNLIIEFTSQGNVGVGDSDGHFHSVYRNPNNEYGAAL